MRNVKQPQGPVEPQDVEELLPWYATGRISREEARGVEAALSTMPDLAQKLAQVQREREAVALSSEAVAPPPPENLQRLLQQVETTRQVRAPKIEKAAKEGDWIGAFFARRQVWQIAFAAACVALVAMGTQLYRPGDIPGTGTTLGAATGMTGIAAGSQLTVVFQPTATSGDIGALLTSLDAVIVDGPKPGNAFVVQLPTADPDAVSAAMAEMLAKKDLVKSVLRGS
jgi:anti-sigma-K factor RskA